MPSFGASFVKDTQCLSLGGSSVKDTQCLNVEGELFAFGVTSAGRLGRGCSSARAPRTPPPATSASMLMWHRRVADAQHSCAYGHLLLLQGLAKALQRKQASMVARPSPRQQRASNSLPARTAQQELARQRSDDLHSIARSPSSAARPSLLAHLSGAALPLLRRATMSRGRTSCARGLNDGIG